MAPCRSSHPASVSEEILGFGRELPTESEEGEEPTPLAGGKGLGSRTRPTASAVERYRPEVNSWIAPLPSTLWQKQQIYTLQQEEDVETKDHRPCLHCPDSRESVILKANTPMTLPEKKKRRGRAEPTTPVSTSGRLPYDYDAVMGITRVGTKEAEGFDEELDTSEYHDAAEEPTRKEETDDIALQQKSTDFQGGYGSSSLKECIELLDTTAKIAPAPLDSGVGQNSTDPPQVMSPSMEGTLTDVGPQPSSGSNSQEAPLVTQPVDGSNSQEMSQVKSEPLSQVKCESPKETKAESSSSTREVKTEHEESENKGESATSVKQEERDPEPDSEDSYPVERVVEVVQRLLNARNEEYGPLGEERETESPRGNPRGRAPVLETSRGQEYGPYAPQGARRARGRYDSPDPFLFNTTIFLEHEADADEEHDPVLNLQRRLRCAEHNVETLRTRLTQVVDLRDTQGIRRDHRTIVARLDEVEEYASARTFREFMTKIHRLESMLVNNDGGTIGEALRLCTRRIDQQQAVLDDVRSRVRAQEGSWEGSEGNSENISGRENRTTDRRRRRVIPAQGIFQSPMPRHPPPPQTSETPAVETDQQAVHRLHAAYNQCVNRTGQLEHRFDQFRFAIHRDATDLALVVHGHDQSVNGHCRELRRLSESLEEVQARITGLDTFTKAIVEQNHQVHQTIDQNTQSQTASTVGIIKEQEDLRKMVEDLAGRLDRSRDSPSTPQGDTSTGVLLDVGDLKTKVARLTEEYVRMDGDVSFLKSLHETVEAIGAQIVKWNNRFPELEDTDGDGDKLPTASEVQDELVSLENTCYTRFHNFTNRMKTLEDMINTLRNSREESWEAVSNRVSTLVESSVTSLSGRVTELEQALQSQRTTPIQSEDVGADTETWAASEQVIWAELDKVREQMQSVPRLYELFENIQQAQQTHEKHLVVLRRFSKQVEQHLEQISRGALPPRTHRQHVTDGSDQGVSQTYVPGASASSSAVPIASIQMPTPPTVSPPPIPSSKDQLSSQSQASSCSPRSQSKQKPHFSTVVGQVRAGAIRVDITNPEEWAAGDVAVIRNQEAKKVRDIGSLIFETPIQHDYEEGVEVRSLLSTEQLEEIDGRLAIVDTNSVSGERVVRFWVDESPTHDIGPPDLRATLPTEQRSISTPVRDHVRGGCSRESPDFGGGVDYHELDPPRRERLPENHHESPPRSRQINIPPEDHNPRGCSLHSMEPLRDWFCRGADMTSASEFEASLCQLEENPPDIREYNANIREERWTHFSLEGVQFPAMTVDVIQRGEALAVFERDLIIHFQQISRAAALYVRALLGGVKRALEVYRRVDATTQNYPWSVQTTEEKWHSHAEGALMVALSSLKLPAEAWKSARILRAIPNCRLVLMLSYHFLSPALSVEENGLMAYLQAPPEAGPSVTQVTTGLQNWKCAGRRLVEIGGRLPTSTQLHQAFVKILSKHLASNKKVNFAFQQQSSNLPLMNPSPAEIVELFSFVEATLIQYATVAGHFPAATAASVKAKPRRANKAELPTEEVKTETQANATGPITPRPKPKAQPKNVAQPTPPKPDPKPHEVNKGGKGTGKGKRGRSESRPEKRKQQCIYFFRGQCQRGDKCKYEHQVGDDGQPVPVAPEILKRFEDAVKRYNETPAQAKPKTAPRGGVSSSMLILESEVLEHGIVMNAAEAKDNDEYYAMVDSGTNAIILPLHPNMEGEIAECQVPSATVTGPIVQTYDFNGSKRLVIALPQSTILVSQEWLTTIAEWEFTSGPKSGSGTECRVTPAGSTKSHVLSIRNGLPYLSKELFWLAMEHLARRAELIKGHSWGELKGMLEKLACEPHPQVYSVKSVEVPEPPSVVFTTVPRTQHFVPSEVRRDIMKRFEDLKPTYNPNRGRVSNSAVSLTFGAQTGRGSERSCIIRRTLEPVYQDLIAKVHELAQNAAGAALPYLGIQILKLEAGQELNQHRDYHNHPDYPNHTMKFGTYSGGSLQMLRYGRWTSYDVDKQWLSFDALRFVHRVQPVTSGMRYSITLYTPGKLERLTAQDWDNLAKAGFPIYLYEPLPAKMRRLATPAHVMKLVSEAKKTQFGRQGRIEAKKQSYHRSEEALIRHLLHSEDPFWEDIPTPSVADPQEKNLLRPKSLLEHCTDAREFMNEFDLNDGFDNQTINLMRVHGHMTRMIGYFQAMLSHAENNDRHGYLWTLTSMFRLVCVMTNEVELAPIFSAACSLKHATDMKKSFATQNEAFDKAKQIGLTPDQAARGIAETPHGRFTLYDANSDEIAKSDEWKPPDFRSLIQAASTEAGKSELSCVIDDTRSAVRARPMILSDETRQTDYTFAHCVATLVQTDDVVDDSTPDELAQTIESHLWLANLEVSSGIAKAMSTTSQMPRDPHPDGPTTMTWHQLGRCISDYCGGSS